MKRRAVIDSGPLVAVFNAKDAFHPSALAFFKSFQGNLYSTIAVLTEVDYLLDFDIQAQLAMLDWVLSGGLEVIELDHSDLKAIRHLTQKYADLPADFADTSLIAVAEKMNIEYVVSIDSDFYAYRTLSSRYLTNLMETG